MTPAEREAMKALAPYFEGSDYHGIYEESLLVLAPFLKRLLAADNKTPSEIAEKWYSEDEVHRILQPGTPFTGIHDEIPNDHTGRDFSRWLTNQYRLAMAKGIQLGRGD